MADPYSGLEGGAGRRARFRAPRFRARDLAGGLAPSFELGERTANLLNVSRTGVAFEGAAHGGPGADADRGDCLTVRIHYAGESAFEARGRVVRRDGDGRLALRFVDQLFDLDHVRSIGQRVAFESLARKGTSAYDAVPAEHRRICAEIGLFLNYWRETLDAREALLAEGDEGEAESREIEASLLPRLREEWQALRLEAATVSNAIPDDHPAYRASKRYTELQLTPLLRPSPFLWRCYEKPLGYPGDYVAMGWMYERPRQAPTIFGRLLDELGYDERLAATVPDRKRLLTSALAGLVAESPGSHRLRVLNLGAGPAGEVEDFLVQAETLRPMTIVLVDQDEDALALAHDRLGQAALRHGDAIEIECRYLSFRQLFSRPDLMQEVGELDLLYSAGLFDYLPDAIAIDLVRSCARLLAPGGRLAVGNAARDHDVRFVPEFLLDWHMIYRAEADMHRLASGLDVPAQASLGRDSSQAWHFLTIQRETHEGRR